jgi:hypothetical protein
MVQHAQTLHEAILCKRTYPWSDCAHGFVFASIALTGQAFLLLNLLRTFFHPTRKALAMNWKILGGMMYTAALLVALRPVLFHLGYRCWGRCAKLSRTRQTGDLVLEAGLDIVFGSIFFFPRIRERIQAALSQHGHEVNVASLIAGFLGGNVDEEGVRKDSVRFFRYILLGDLTFKDMLDATSGARSQDVFQRSQPALLGEIDAFVSHSWHDDTKAKWDALQTWCTAFSAKHGRQPKLWLDFCCIDQTNIEAHLRCLPVFLSGCHDILIIAGPTYVRRLWCAIELFVFVSIHGSTLSAAEVDEGVVSSSSSSLHDRVHVLVLAQTEEEHSSVRESFSNFDVMQCECSELKDKDRLLGIVEAGSGTRERFNTQVRGMLGSLQETV